MYFVLTMSHTPNDETTTRNADVCATCGQPLQGPYCSQCGEKKLDKHDRRVISIFEEVIHSFTHADSKFLRSLKYLFTRPGFLTNEYLAGRRKRYSTPLSLFFIANLLYLLASPVDTFNSRFESMITGQPYSQAIIPQARQKMQKKHWTFTQIQEHYDEKSSHVAKLMLVGLIFLLSIPAAILFISRKRYYYDYVVFSLEYVNFIMWGFMLLIPWLLILVAIVLYLMGYRGHGSQLNINSPYLFGGVLLILWAYLAIAAQRVFNQWWGLTFLKAGVLMVCTVLAMYFYRFLVFEATIFLL